MKAIRVHQFGGVDQLKVEEVPDLMPGTGQVVIKVKAVGVNPVDTYIRSGTYGPRPLPFTPGSDASGTIEAVGAGVTEWKPGNRVYTSQTATGAYAEQVLAPASGVYRLPDTVSFEAGAGVNVPYATAFRALVQRANGKPGETVLVHGASGGVGIAAVQIARAYGFKVWGTAGTEDGLRLAREQGAHFTHNHKVEGYLDAAKAQTPKGRGFDIILEMLANVNLARDLTALAPRGRVVVIGNRGSIEINPRETMGRDASILGMSLFNATPDELVEIHAAIYAGLENQTLRPVIGRTFPLSEAAQAHEAVMQSGAHGKIVLLPGR